VAQIVVDQIDRLADLARGDHLCDQRITRARGDVDVAPRPGAAVAALAGPTTVMSSASANWNIA